MKKLSIVLFLFVSAFATVSLYANEPWDKKVEDPIIITCLTGSQTDLVQAEACIEVSSDMLK